MKQETRSGSLTGAILLIGGSCIGGGMLALPVITGLGGFVPSILFLIAAWLFMATTGMLLLEANLTLGYRLSLVSIAEQTLGKTGKVLCWILFAFLFYSLSLAYISASGGILKVLIFEVFEQEIPPWAGSLLFTFAFGIVLLIGTRSVDYINRILMVGLIVSYSILVLIGIQYLTPQFLLARNWKYTLVSLPILVISFGFHNMIPSLAQYLEGDVKRLRLAIFLGSMMPLAVYFIWEVVMLGVIPPDLRLDLFKKGSEATQIMFALMGKSWLSFVTQSFGLFAVITSFLAQSLSLVDFLADGLKVKKSGIQRLFLVLLTLAPPFILAMIYPDIFIMALNIAGGFAAVVLFGLFPACMIWKLRYTQKISLVPLMPTGKLLLVIVFALGLVIFFVEAAQEFGLSFLPQEMEAVP